MSPLQIGNGFPISTKSELASWVALGVKNLSANTGDVRDSGLISGLGRSPGGGHGNPLQHSSVENPMDRGAWRATFHGVAESDTRSNLAYMQHKVFLPLNLRNIQKLRGGLLQELWSFLDHILQHKVDHTEFNIQDSSLSLVVFLRNNSLSLLSSISW